MYFRLDGLIVKYLGINFQDITVNNSIDVSNNIKTLNIIVFKNYNKFKTLITFLNSEI